MKGHIQKVSCGKKGTDSVVKRSMRKFMIRYIGKISLLTVAIGTTGSLFISSIGVASGMENNSGGIVGEIEINETSGTDEIGETSGIEADEIDKAIEETIVQTESIDIGKKAGTVEAGNLATLFIGDSRTVGMSAACGLSKIDNTFVMAKVGEGYSYLSSNLKGELNRLKSNGYDEVKIVTNFGVNDIYNIDKYLSYYDKVLNMYDDSSITLVIVSVNPVEYCDMVNNQQIEAFNSELKQYAESRQNVEFIDTYSKLSGRQGTTVDGLHYNKRCYTEIYEEIKSGIS